MPDLANPAIMQVVVTVRFLLAGPPADLLFNLSCVHLNNLNKSDMPESAAKAACRNFGTL